MVRASEHIREIERVLSGACTGRDATVAESWQRCYENHRLDPSRACEAYIVTETELREHRDASERLIHTARAGLETLHGQLAGQGYVLLLANPKGVTVDFIGDPTFDNTLRKAGLYLGSEWSEPRAGTCAVGSCIATGEALVIHQDDHFDVTHTSLTCTAAPIYDTAGELAAVLDISALRSPELKASQNLVLHMVGAAVRRIELANLMASAKGEWVLRFSRSPDFVDVDPEAAITLDGAGHVVAMTHAGRKLLAAGRGQDWRGIGKIVGRKVTDFLDLDIETLPELMRGVGSDKRIVRGRSGTAVFAHAIAPQSRYDGAPLTIRKAPAKPASASDAFSGLHGGDPHVAAVAAKAEKLARAKLPIVVTGETGTGKERFARAIHEASGRRGRFVAVNAAALPESLIEGELFGHAPGAFTGARAKGRKGLIEESSGGTLFLDEIGDMPLGLQGRLLRVLSEGELVPVGASLPVALNLRVVSATHRDIFALVQRGEFRADLAYRLAGATLAMPPLRERSDIVWLAEQIATTIGAGLDLDADAMELLRDHSWPGNIRELKNVLEAAAAIGGGHIRADVLADMLETSISALAGRSAFGGMDCVLPQSEQRPAGAMAHRPFQDEAFDAQSLEAGLRATGWNISAYARGLGVDRTTVHRRMKRFGIVSPNHRDS